MAKEAKESALKERKEKERRNFYVNGKLEFSFFFDEEEKKPKKIIEEFLKNKDWISFANYCKLKFVSFQYSDDLSEFKMIAESTEEKPKTE